ncbi:MAG: hypothetical protein HY707_00280 [Ignavibacteriae bacterium]|nr:hypothetical protein [Ignavibacteriota bacterium]
MALLDIVDPDRDRSKFTLAQQRQAIKVEQAWRKRGLPEGFVDDGDVHIRREPGSGVVYISNKAQQMAMLNEGRIELYWQCPGCRNEGFKNTLIHTLGCSYETKPFGLSGSLVPPPV